MEHKTHIKVEGMHCSNCALGVSRYLEKQGFQSVSVNFSSGDVSFEAPDSLNLQTLSKGISGLGFTMITEDHAPGHDHSLKKGKISLETLFVFCMILTLPLLLHMVLDIELLNDPLFQFSLALPVYIAGAFYFGKSALSSLKTGIPNMDVLIITGATAAMIYSTIGMLLYKDSAMEHHYLFFETSSAIITLVLLGNLIEKRSVKRTTSAIQELAALQPVVALKISVNQSMQEQFEEVFPEKLEKGDAVLVNMGAVVPVDGTIYWGTASIDEAALTGEGIPVEKENGDKVLAGSVVLSGTIKVTTEKPGGKTLLADIIQLVKDAQMNKPEIQKLGDKISAWFVPVVLGIAIITFLISWLAFDITLEASMMHSIAVLVISCPCAMGLATPTAVAVGLGKAAKQGILIKGGDTLELLNDVKTIVFDKTGTLTSGEFVISSFHIDKNEDPSAVKSAVFSLEQHSVHPLAKSILTEFSMHAPDWIPLTAVEEIKGLGIQGTDEKGNVWKVGSYKSVQQLQPEPGHTIYITKNNSVVAWMDVQDQVREEAFELIRQLHAKGYKTAMLSGDSAKRCEEVASMTGITEVFSDCLPDEKMRVIDRLKSAGKVIMVGDGINDGPSLTRADIGISFGKATKVAMNAAQIIITDKQGLLKVAEAIALGKKTYSTIRQNLFWAFFYNVIAIPVAAVGLLSPIIAALSMAFSDVVVIGNSLRLRFSNSKNN